MSNQSPDASILPPDTLLFTLAEFADRLGVKTTHVRDLIGERKLICVYKNGVRHLPVAFLTDKGTLNKFVPGVIALLIDGGYSDAEIFRYLFTDDPSLPGQPIAALHGHLAREVMRRAQAMAL